MFAFTKQQAEERAKHDRNYVVKKLRRPDPVTGETQYGVWDKKSDHLVEFDYATRRE